MKQVNLKWLTEPVHLERLATRALFADDDDDDYLVGVIRQIREFYDKTWRAIPGELTSVIERIELILK